MDVPITFTPDQQNIFEQVAAHIRSPKNETEMK